MREISFQKALDEAVAEEMRRDPRVITMATDFTGDPIKEFGPARVRFSPISEAVLTGMGLGAAGCGIRPIVNWRMVTFSFVAMDQIVNQASKIRYMFGGQADFPVTYRCSTGGGIGLAAQHSQSPYSMWMHLAGLKIILPSTPADAKGLLKSAIRDNNPVVSFECSRLAALTGPVPDGDHLVPIGVAEVKRAGTDVTIVGLAYYVHEALAVAEELAREGISVEVVDPRTLVPLDVDTLRASVRKTGRVVIVDEAPATCSAASEIAALIVEDPETFRALKAPVRRVCAAPVPVPYSPHAGTGGPAEPGRHQGRGLRGPQGVPASRLADADDPHRGREVATLGDRRTPVADALVDFVLGLELGSLPHAVIEAAGLSLTDWLGAALRGSTEPLADALDAVLVADGRRPAGDGGRARAPDERAAGRARQRRPRPRARFRRHAPGLHRPRLGAGGARGARDGRVAPAGRGPRRSPRSSPGSRSRRGSGA